MSNVISSLTYGRRFEYDDPQLLKLLDRLHAGVEEDQGLLREVRGERRGGGLALNRASGRRAWGEGVAGEKPFRGGRPGGGEVPEEGDGGGGPRIPGEGYGILAPPSLEATRAHEIEILDLSDWAPGREKGSRPKLGRNHVSGGDTPEAGGRADTLEAVC